MVPFPVKAGEQTWKEQQDLSSRTIVIFYPVVEYPKVGYSLSQLTKWILKSHEIFSSKSVFVGLRTDLTLLLSSIIVPKYPSHFTKVTLVRSSLLIA